METNYNKLIDLYKLTKSVASDYSNLILLYNKKCDDNKIKKFYLNYKDVEIYDMPTTSVEWCNIIISRDKEYAVTHFVKYTYFYKGAYMYYRIDNSILSILDNYVIVETQYNCDVICVTQYTLNCVISDVYYKSTV